MGAFIAGYITCFALCSLWVFMFFVTKEESLNTKDTQRALRYEWNYKTVSNPFFSNFFRSTIMIKQD